MLKIIDFLKLPYNKSKSCIRILTIIWIIWNIICISSFREGVNNRLRDCTADLFQESVLGRVRIHDRSLVNKKLPIVKNVNSSDLEILLPGEWQNINESLLETFNRLNDKNSIKYRHYFPIFGSISCNFLNNFGSWGLEIHVHDNIMENPKLVRNLIKVAKNPCHYLVDAPKLDESGEKLVDFDQANHIAASLGCKKIRNPISENIGLTFLELFFSTFPDLFFVKIIFEHDDYQYPPIFIKREDVYMNPLGIIMPILALYYISRMFFLSSRKIIIWGSKGVKKVFRKEEGE